jgi:hypothetical protein
MSGFGATSGGQTSFSPGLPSVGVRYGVADRVDVGARVADLSSLEADLKYNFVRGRFDMAIDPGVQGYYYTASGVPPFGMAQFHVPLLLGLNFDEDTTVVLSPGFFGAVATTGVQLPAFTPGIGARLGLGLNVRVSDSLSWQPEVTVWHELYQSDSWVYVFGIGANVGPQPDYSDLSSEAPQ